MGANLELEYGKECIDGIENIILNFPNEAWFDRKWFIALISIVIGALLSIFLQNIMEFIKNKRARRHASRNLLMEVFVNRTHNEKYLQSIIDLKEEFLAKPRAGHPNFMRTGLEVQNTHFQLHNKDLIFFPKSLQSQIYMFYQYTLKTIGQGAVLLEKQFIKYYDGDKTVGDNDIKNALDRYIKNTQNLFTEADDILGHLLKISKENRDLVYGKETIYLKKNKKIDKKLSDKKIGDIIDIIKLSEELAVDGSHIVLRIVNRKDFIRVGTGRYEKIEKDNFLVKLFKKIQ